MKIHKVVSVEMKGNFWMSSEIIEYYFKNLNYLTEIKVILNISRLHWMSI